MQSPLGTRRGGATFAKMSNHARVLSLLDAHLDHSICRSGFLFALRPASTVPLAGQSKRIFRQSGGQISRPFPGSWQIRHLTTAGLFSSEQIGVAYDCCFEASRTWANPPQAHPGSDAGGPGASARDSLAGQVDRPGAPLRAASRTSHAAVILLGQSGTALRRADPQRQRRPPPETRTRQCAERPEAVDGGRISTSSPGSSV